MSQLRGLILSDAHYQNTLKDSLISQQCSHFLNYLIENVTLFIQFCHALLLSSQSELFAFLIDENIDWERVDILFY
jgi:hypothetical protein